MKSKIGVSDFVKRQIKGSGKTYSSLSFKEIALIAEKQLNSGNFKPGYRDGVLLISIDKSLLHKFTCPIVKINNKTKFIAKSKKRRPDEDSYISIKATNGIPVKLEGVDLVIYRKDVLKESNENTTNADWELIAFHGIPRGYKDMPIGPITMMRNQLALVGGTKAEYKSSEWAESVNFWQKYAMLQEKTKVAKK